MNRKDINDLLKIILPVSSAIIGAPRREMNMQEYVNDQSNSSKIVLHETAEFQPVLPSIFRLHQIVSNYQTFTAKLELARVWGRNGAVIASGDYFIRDVSREFNKGMDIDHSIFYTIKQKKSQLIRGNVAVIGTAGANIYYHWMLDILPRLALVAKTISLNNIDYFITEFTGLPFQIETLAKLRLGKEKIIASNENWQFHVKSETLWVPSLAGPLDQPTIFQVNFLRSLFKDCMKFDKPYRRLYISRKKTARRAIVNENELRLCLSIYQFEIIYCEDLTVAEQVTLFSEASVVVCSHGSALTNLVFCMAGTIVLDIFNDSHLNPCFWFISQILHLDYNHLTGISKAIDENPKNDNTEVDIDAFKFKLIEIGLVM